jgi:hypothetical protein
MEHGPVVPVDELTEDLFVPGERRAQQAVLVQLCCRLRNVRLHPAHGHWRHLSSVEHDG